MLKYVYSLSFSFLFCLIPLHAEDSWQAMFTVKNDSGNLYLPATWNPDTGLKLDVQAEGSAEHLRLFIGADEMLAAMAASPAALVENGTFWGRLLGLRGSRARVGERPVEYARYAAGGLPKAALGDARLVLKVRPGVWTVYVNDYPVMSLPAPMSAPFTVALPASCLLAGHPARFQKVDSYHFAADFLIPEEEKNQLGPWKPESGTWYIHSALDDALEQKSSTVLTSRPLEAERSANFYCLNGQGEGGIITSGYAFLDDYRLEASMRLDAGEMGLVFYYQGPRDYYEMALTVPEVRNNTVLVRLRRHSSTRVPRRTVLAAVEVEMTSGQWVMPRVEIHHGRIAGYLDNTLLFEVKEALPVGGKFGLTVSADESIRFDDVAVDSVTHLPLETGEDVRFHTSAIMGDFYPLQGEWGPAGERSCGIVPRVSGEEKGLLVGSLSQEPRVVQTRFSQKEGHGEYGLLTAYRGAEQPYLRFVRRLSEVGESFLLEEVKGTESRTLERLHLPVAGEALPATAVTLMVDPTIPRQLRLYRDDELVLIHYPEQELGGASGVYVGAETRVHVSNLEVRGERQELHHSKQEKNQIYVTDPYMRHWSSPEGQWVTDDKGIMWHKGDFFDRFELYMPYVSGSEVHLGVAEGSSTGALVLTAKGHSLTVRYGNAEAGAAPIVVAQLPKSVKEIDELIAVSRQDPANAVAAARLKAAYGIHVEDGWLWLTDADGKLLEKAHFGEALQGRRMRLGGLNYDHLMYSHVVIFNQKDYLFSQAPHDWTVNGGRWQIINRFQCDPRWSHFNGENGDDLAALWGKYVFSGDFSVEMYAGVRHGWYQRAGDLNITIMNQESSAGSGYSIVTTGWDPNESQLWSYLYRNGELIDRSDKYLAPRRRQGNDRAKMHALEATGRPIHGAWYYLKVRRIGNIVEYSFDNDQVFRYEDPDPIPAGSLGLWTYRASMMIARVRVTAEKIEPRPIVFRPAPLKDGPYHAAPVNEVDEASFAAILNHDRAASMMLPSEWSAEDAVGHSTVSWHLENRRTPYFVTTNTLGGGTMQTGQQVARPVGDLAGWSFDFKRTPGALVNLHYSVGYMKPRSEDGKELAYDFTPLRHFYHHLAGEAFEDAVFQKHGETLVAPITRQERDWYRHGDWVRVTAWLPHGEIATLQVPEPTPLALAKDDEKELIDAINRLLTEHEHPRELYIRIDGFGALQPSLVQTGLRGNQPGAAYAVRDFAPVRYSPPRLALRPETDLFSRYLLLDGNRNVLTESSSLAPMERWLELQRYDGLQQVTLRAIGRGGKDVETLLSWIQLPEQPEIACVWDDQQPNTLKLQALAPYADPRFPAASLEVNGAVMPLQARSPFARLALLPPPTGAREEGRTLEVTVRAGDYTFSKTMNAAAMPAGSQPEDGTPGHAPPMLLSLKGPFGLFANFEDKQLDRGIFTGATTINLGHLDKEQGSFLHTRNTAIGQRLQLAINKPFNIYSHPLLQYRYRASEQAVVSINYGTFFYVDLGERRFQANHGGTQYTAHAVRYGEALQTDDQWHSWLGMLSDVPAREPYSVDLLSSPSLSFASFSTEDQTGKFSSLDYDDIVLGPAVSKNEQLTITPTYGGYDFVKQVSVAILPGPKPYHARSLEEREMVQWQTIPNGESFTPELSGLEAGIAHLLLTAMDGRGVRAQVTDLPFCYDNSPLTASQVIGAWNDPVGNGTALMVTFKTNDLAPLDPRSLTFKVDGKAVDARSPLATFTHRPDLQLLTLDHPFLFRDRFNGMKDGESFDLVIDGIRDGAGNASPAMTVPIKVDHASDKVGPAWLPAKLPKNILMSTAWEGRSRKGNYLEAARGNALAVQHVRGEEPYLRTHTYGANGSLSYEPKHWDLALFTHVAMRLRQPEVRNDKPTQVNIVITFTDDRRLVLPLTRPARGGNNIELEKPPVFASNKWISVNFNLHAVARKKWGSKIADLLVVKTLVISRSAAQNSEALDLQSMFVYTPWRTGNTVILDAYDASGVADYLWTYLDSAEKEVATGKLEQPKAAFADLQIPWKEGGWLLIQARDKAGNLSVPLRFPAPIADLLSPTEEAALLK